MTPYKAIEHLCKSKKELLSSLKRAIENTPRRIIVTTERFEQLQTVDEDSFEDYLYDNFLSSQASDESRSIRDNESTKEDFYCSAGECIMSDYPDCEGCPYSDIPGK